MLEWEIFANVFSYLTRFIYLFILWELKPSASLLISFEVLKSLNIRSVLDLSLFLFFLFLN